MKYFFFLLSLVLVLTSNAAIAVDDFLDFNRASDTKVIVSNIAVEGAERVDPSTIISYLDIKPGDEYTQSGLSSSLKNLYETGLFADVNIEQRASKLIVKVVENPVINRVAFEGNSDVEDGELAAEISSRPRAVYVRNKVRSDVDRIQNIYRRRTYFESSFQYHHTSQWY